MALTYVPMTELEAVNAILEAVGEAPVQSLTESGNTDAALAYRKLASVNRAIQSRGFHCNTEEKYPLAKDGNSKIPVPANAMRVDYSDNDKDLVMRGGFLYDRENHTFIFSENSLDVDITFFLPFSDLPQILREYITIKAGREFQQKHLGSGDLDGFSEEDEKRTWVEVYRQEYLNRDESILDNPTAFNIVNRRF